MIQIILLIKIMANIQLECTTEENIIVFLGLFIKIPLRLPIKAEIIMSCVIRWREKAEAITHRGAIFCHVKRTIIWGHSVLLIICVSQRWNGAIAVLIHRAMIMVLTKIVSV